MNIISYCIEFTTSFIYNETSIIQNGVECIFTIDYITNSYLYLQIVENDCLNPIHSLIKVYIFYICLISITWLFFLLVRYRSSYIYWIQYHYWRAIMNPYPYVTGLKILIILFMYCNLGFIDYKYILVETHLSQLQGVCNPYHIEDGYVMMMTPSPTEGTVEVNPSNSNINTNTNSSDRGLSLQEKLSVRLTHLKELRGTNVAAPNLILDGKDVTLNSDEKKFLVRISEGTCGTNNRVSIINAESINKGNHENVPLNNKELTEGKFSPGDFVIKTGAWNADKTMYYDWEAMTNNRKNLTYLKGIITRADDLGLVPRN